MKLSVVATLYKSPEAIPELVDRITAVCAKIAHDDYEIILVDDCCPQGSGRIAEELVPRFPSLKVISLSRNFGQHKAVMTGLKKSVGDWTFVMDGDLDEEPEWLEHFWESELRQSHDVVFGYQPNSRRGPVDMVLGNAAYFLINRFSDFEIPRNMVTARIMTRNYVDALVAHRDQVPWLAGLWVATGFRQAGIEVVKHRLAKTSYGLRAKLWQLILSSTSFSTKPVEFITGLGASTFIVGLVIAAVSVVRWSTGAVLEGWTSLLISLWLLGGTILLALGVMSHYLSIIVNEVKPRPYVVIRRETSGADERP